MDEARTAALREHKDMKAMTRTIEAGHTQAVLELAEAQRLERWSAWRCAVMRRWLPGVLGRREGAAQAAAQAKKRPRFWAAGALPVRTSWSPLAEMTQRPIGLGAERWRPARRPTPRTARAPWRSCWKVA